MRVFKADDVLIEEEHQFTYYKVFDSLGRNKASVKYREQSKTA